MTNPVSADFLCGDEGMFYVDSDLEGEEDGGEGDGGGG